MTGEWRRAPGGLRPAGTALRAARALAAALALTLALTACQGATGSTGPEKAPDGGPQLADVTPVTDPKALVGGSTALLTDATISTPATPPHPTLPVTLTDMQGTEVTVTDTSRILALDVYGSTTRIVYELGLGANLVGRDASSSFPEVAGLPLVTQSGHDLNAEAILALAPTLIITDTSLGPWDVVLQMRDAGIAVVVVDSERSLANTGSLINEVATAVGLPAEGAALAERVTTQIDAKVAQIAAVAPVAAADKLRIVFLYVRGQAGVYYMFGTDSGADSLVKALGGIDVATEIGWSGMRPVSDEGLISAQPDVVLVMSDGLDSAGGVDGLLESIPALAQTPAGERRRIVDMDDSEILSFGPGTAGVLDALAVALYAPQNHAPQDPS
ncbi:iron complex transport system substrate-binding protein [Sanguibacter gelidistatuariae]|uniref:Iron complex transport system substrate-binding protein n=1 Tax=Sanguibacter gelidistatuariae TaxID=1814289 RepID=A0A1G6VNK2_9MICO|nr:ABC transporter substrate-binding protein [Sanguibacter gelidistatuariae]SDD54993.1 iron complex transport system substrate-binding protein [Sanguibacter gelidistatuariae]